MPPYERWNKERAADIIAQHADKAGPALPILHALQATFGHVADEAVALVADALNLSRAEVHGIVTFYHDFRAAPAGAHVLKLCRAEACQSMGSDHLAEAVAARLGVKLGETGADGSITVEPVYCLGLCACAPAAMLDGRPIGRLDAARLDELIAEAQP